MSEKEFFKKLYDGKKMTQVRFVSSLNENFKKPSGKPFIAQDVYGYVKKGHVPYRFGLYSIKYTKDNRLGVKLVMITEVIVKGRLYGQYGN